MLYLLEETFIVFVGIIITKGDIMSNYISGFIMSVTLSWHLPVCTVKTATLSPHLSSPATLCDRRESDRQQENKLKFIFKHGCKTLVNRESSRAS